jgi:hypothetical protein
MSVRPRGASSSRTALAIAGLIVVLRLPSILASHCIDDENIYAVVGGEIASGGLPYVSAIERKPPLLLFVYAAVQRVFGIYNFVALHVVATLWALATMLGVYLATRAVFGSRGVSDGRDVANSRAESASHTGTESPAAAAFAHHAGLAAALLYGIFLPFSVYRNLAWNGEMLMNLPIAFAYALAFAPSRRPARLALHWAGMLIALAALLKQPAAIALAPLLIYVLLPSYRANRGLSLAYSLLHALWLGLGFAVTIALNALLLAKLGILREAVFWSITHHDVPHGLFDPVFWERGSKGVLAFALACAPVCVGAFMILRRSSDRFAGRAAERSSLLALVACSAIGTAASGRFYPHYFIQLLLPLAILAGAWVAQLYAAGRQARPFAWVARWIGLSAFMFFVSHGLSFWQARNLGPVATYIREHAGPDDRMFVWGQAPELYLEARCRPASRYVATFPLTGYVFASPIGQDPSIDTSDRIVPGSWETLARELTTRPPAFIVDADGAHPQPRYPIADYPFLREMLDEDYSLVMRAPEGLVYERSGLASATR